MNLCSGSRSNSHDEVCFESNDCPVCEVIKEVDEQKDKVRELESEVERLEAELSSIQEPIIASLKTTQQFHEKGQPNEQPIPKADG